MSSSRRPWYKWYPKDFITDEKVQSLSAHAEVVYRRALDVMWQANDQQLPSNCQKLANALSKGLSQGAFENAWDEIQTRGFELFKTSECGQWIYSKRLKEEAKRIENTSKIRSELGKKGAQAKAKAIAKSLLKPGLSDTDTDIIPPIVPQGTKSKNEYSDSFESWWKLYPAKIGKDAAYRSWKKISKKNTVSVRELTDAITAQIANNHFGNPGSEFIPNPSTWLNQGRWKDEIRNKYTPKKGIPVC